MYLFEVLKDLIKTYLPGEQIEYLQQAYIVARDAHSGQLRLSGEPYITHPVAVACILAEMKLEYEILMAALLHDVIEDTPATYQDMEHLFGKNIAKLIEGVSKLDKLKFQNKKEAQAENFRKMIMAMVQDIRVIFIKLADRVHNMRTLDSFRADKRHRIARETLEIYSPLAHRLGIYHIKTELEELSFKALHPNRYRMIKEFVKTLYGNHKEIIQNILSEIEGCLHKAGIFFRVSIRKKYLYSAYCKIEIEETHCCSVIDIYEFCIIVHDLDTCYRVLGQMHKLYKPKLRHIKDYIAIPKENGYQSLHTSIIGPYGVPIEIQIRTEDMNQIAEMGIAAYWTYKKYRKTNTIVQVYTKRWIQTLLKLQQSTNTSFEFIESVKSNFFPKKIHTITSDNYIFALQIDAEPINFAHVVNPDIRHVYLSTYINRKLHSLSQAYTSGKAVEITIASDSYSNVTWLNFIVTLKSRAKIFQLLKTLNIMISLI